ncbi:IQ calmodulin-binding motif domain-containing protein [Toxoplasma gondii VEG]|uniref:IQ calmodulin-binding motif domain-containing protein n=2 Tax=Toxoplasma gondii TaxID=5811 RepID=V4ZCR2_TOXGV|nr:IQ calmodulin-binding motif domain-containing protein [Toxoplasma gondii VEG]
MKLVACTAWRAEKKMHDAATVLQTKVRGFLARRSFLRELFHGPFPEDVQTRLCPYRAAVEAFHSAKTQDRRESWMRAHRRWMAEETLKEQKEAFFGAPPSPRETANPAAAPQLSSPRASSSLCRRPHSSEPAAETREDLLPAASRRRRSTSEHAGFSAESPRAWHKAPFSVEDQQGRGSTGRRSQIPFPVYQSEDDGQPRAARARTRLEMQGRSRSARPDACSSGEFVLTHLKSSTLTVRQCKQLRREFASHVHSENEANSENEAVGSPRLPRIVRGGSPSPRRRGVEASEALRGRHGGRDGGIEDACCAATGEPEREQEVEGVNFASTLSRDVLKDRRVHTPHGGETSEKSIRLCASSGQKLSPSRKRKSVLVASRWTQQSRELCEARTHASDAQAAFFPLSESRKDLTCRRAVVSLSRRPVDERDQQLQTLLLQLRQAIREDEKRAARREREEDEDVRSLLLRGGKSGENCEESSHRLLLPWAPAGRLAFPDSGREDENMREEGEKRAEGQTRKNREQREEGNATNIYGQDKTRTGDRRSEAAADFKRKMKERGEKTREELAAFCAFRGLRECQHPHHHPEIPFLHPLAALCDAAVKVQRWLRRIYRLRTCRAKLAALWRRRQFEKLLKATKAALLQWMRHSMLTPQDEAAMLVNREHAERLRELSARRSRAATSAGRAGQGKALALPRVETRRLLVRLPFTCRSHSFATRSEVEKQQKQLRDTIQHIALLRRQQQQTARSRKLWNRWKSEHDRAARGDPPESTTDAGGGAISRRAARGEAAGHLGGEAACGRDCVLPAHERGDRATRKTQRENAEVSGASKRRRRRHRAKRQPSRLHSRQASVERRQGKRPFGARRERWRDKRRTTRPPLLSGNEQPKKHQRKQLEETNPTTLAGTWRRGRLCQSRRSRILPPGVASRPQASSCADVLPMAAPHAGSQASELPPLRPSTSCGHSRLRAAVRLRRLRWSWATETRRSVRSGRESARSTVSFALLFSVLLRRKCLCSAFNFSVSGSSAASIKLQKATGSFR